MSNAWTIEDSANLYNVDGWGADYFSINEKGHVQVAPRANGISIDLCELVSEIQKRGLELPLLIRFPDIIDSQITRLNQAFASAILEYEYKATYRGVFPIKVNQQRQIIEEVATFGKRYRMGLEIGSKPELLIALTMLDPEDGFIICNGYKDHDFIEMALLAKQLGFVCIIVIERLAELESILRVSHNLGIEPMLGVRAKMATRGEGKWSESGGDRAKFGVRADELMQILRILRGAGKLECLSLLHFHIGSQIPTVRTVSAALNEASRLYVELSQAGAALSYLDIGGGLAVDYDGFKSGIANSSANYDMNEYARCVVQTISEACDEAGVPHPTIVSESGRALVSHHSVMVMEVLDTDSRRQVVPERTTDLDDEPRVVTNLYNTLELISASTFQEAYHDAVRFRDEAVTLFNHGILRLEDRARAEQLFICCGRLILKTMASQVYIPEELSVLEENMADTYYCNLSFFQSLPDSWAIDQIFPILPLHRLKEEPLNRAVLADVTCDSDGRIDHFVDLHNEKKVLEVHEPGEEQYLLGAFLVGAYQEILGDLHNLFGDTHALHVKLTDQGYRIANVVEGDTMAEVLSYIEYSRSGMVEAVRSAAEKALERGDMNLAQAKLLRERFRANLDGYTYLVS